MFLKQNICWLIAIRAKFISVLIFVSTVRMLSGRQFEQLTIIILIARIQLILQLNRLRTAVEQLTRKNIIAQTVLSNNKIMSSRFFEQSNFEQMIMTQCVKDHLKEFCLNLSKFFHNNSIVSNTSVYKCINCAFFYLNTLILFILQI
jgi:hypothetical protein